MVFKNILQQHPHFFRCSKPHDIEPAVSNENLSKFGPHKYEINRFVYSDAVVDAAGYPGKRPFAGTAGARSEPGGGPAAGGGAAAGGAADTLHAAMRRGHGPGCRSSTGMPAL